MDTSSIFNYQTFLIIANALIMAVTVGVGFYLTYEQKKTVKTPNSSLITLLQEFIDVAAAVPGINQAEIDALRKLLAELSQDEQPPLNVTGVTVVNGFAYIDCASTNAKLVLGAEDKFLDIKFSYKGVYWDSHQATYDPTTNTIVTWNKNPDGTPLDPEAAEKALIDRDGHL